MNSSLSGLLTGYNKEKLQHTDLVLATIVTTHGSTYAKPGARMLISSAGTNYGFTGGDYVHRVVKASAEKVFKAREPVMLELKSMILEDVDLSQELEAGASMGLFLEPVKYSANNTLDLLTTACENRSNNILVTVCESGMDDCQVGANTLLIDNELVYSDLQPAYTDVLQEICRTIDVNNSPVLESCIFANGTLTAFFDIIRPPVSLLIIGAGPDAVPMIGLARQMGWDVTVADSREEFTGNSEIAAADRVITTAPEDLGTRLDLDGFDATVLMTHRLDLDEKFLSVLKGNTKLKYIGLLGTSRRRERLLHSVSINPLVSREKIYAPVGLDLGGKLPEQVALSVISEIQAVLHARRGGHLTAAALLPKHEPPLTIRDLYGVILAAGGSRRFGGIKQLLEYKGKSLLRRVMEVSTTTLGNRVKLVLGIKSNKLKREADNYDLEVVVNRDWENGVASSVRAGISALPENCRAVMIILCDQPLIDHHHLKKLVDKWLQEPGKITASEYNSTLGVPAIFPREYFDDMLKLQGDRGAKSIIESNMGNVTAVSIPEAGTDINTQEDVISLLQQ